MLQLTERPLSIFQVWTTSIALWSACFKKVQLLVVLYIVLMTSITYSLFGTSVLKAYFNQHFLIKLLAFTPVGMVLSVIFYTMVYYLIYLATQNKTQSFWDVFIFSLKKLAVMIPASIFATLLLFLGFALFFFPGLYLTVVFWLYFPLIIVEHLDPITGLKRVFQLIQDHWWFTAAVIGLPFLILDTFLFLLPTLSAKLHIIQYMNEETWHSIQFYRLAILAFYTPIFLAMVVVQIRNLEIRQMLISMEAQPVGNLNNYNG